MTDAARDLVVAILRQCVRVAPSPWQAADFARGTRASGSSGVPDEQMEACLALLRAEGVIKPAVGRNGEVLLTPDGARIAKDPNDLDYFCAEINFALPGEGPSGNPLQRKVIAATLRQPPVPRLSRLMLWANLLVFAWGVWLAAQRNVVFEFLLYVPGQRVNLQDIFDRSGMLQRDDFVSGRWWRLLTCCYVHFGLLHLVLNMLALRAVGRDVEWTWGGWRFLVIYLLSGLGGSCAALLALPVGAIAGASGAICGLVAAVAVWLVLNRRYLPRRMVRRASIH
ncbi:MAG: rhomboid family intramembrane serine protease, partial [Planctomycetes bacterium]|nr:rhomboid family intramembrane serine protease [Planctomycetota bacterium]